MVCSRHTTGAQSKAGKHRDWENKGSREPLGAQRGSTAWEHGELTPDARYPGRCQLQGGPPFPKVSLRDQKCQLGNPGPRAGVPADTFQEKKWVRLSTTREGGAADSYDLLRFKKKGGGGERDAKEKGEGGRGGQVVAALCKQNSRHKPGNSKVMVPTATVT